MMLPPICSHPHMGSVVCPCYASQLFEADGDHCGMMGGHMCKSCEATIRANRRPQWP